MRSIVSLCFVSGLWAVAALPRSAVAAERPFAFTWDSRTLGPNGRELEAWVTPRLGRVAPYTRFESRVGYGQSLTGHLDAHVYLDVTTIAEPSTTLSAVPALVAQTKVSVFDGTTDALGLAFVGSVSFTLDRLSTQTIGLMLRAILDKQVGALRVALDLGATYSDRLRLEQNLGLGYRLGAGGWLVGLELSNRLGFAQGFAGDAFFIGPALSYRGSAGWVALSFVPQVAAMKRASQVGLGDPLELIDHERFLMRLSFGVLAL